MENENLLWPSPGNVCDLYHPPLSLKVNHILLPLKVSPSIPQVSGLELMFIRKKLSWPDTFLLTLL